MPSLEVVSLNKSCNFREMTDISLFCFFLGCSGSSYNCRHGWGDAILYSSTVGILFQVDTSPPAKESFCQRPSCLEIRSPYLRPVTELNG